MSALGIELEKAPVKPTSEYPIASIDEYVLLTPYIDFRLTSTAQ